MQHVLRLVIKFIACLVALGIILGMFYAFSFGDVLAITAVLGLVSYILGDLILLRATNNVMATAADFALAFLVVWFMGRALTVEDDLFSASLISALAVAGFEYFYHKFLVVKDQKQTTRSQIQPRPQFQTEASEELTPVREDVRSQEDGNK
ncbi:YndM family protein [Neobacillus niacini]|uniref:YndM family protein n=1 Tax=Neobacillus niacini TaxID=86668 RepID=UPI0021CB73A8|nr:YndM family protein [Neobacillus niacini]MCM3764525.1 YndM family protein [Neobacillus niacini]